jgi:PhnB protein
MCAGLVAGLEWVNVFALENGRVSGAIVTFLWQMRAQSAGRMKAQFVPSNYPRVAAKIAARDAAAAIAFYTEMFGAKERFRLAQPDGRIAHAELEFGSDGLLIISDRFEGWSTTPDELEGRSTVVLHLYVEDVDATVQRAVDAGAQLLLSPADQFYGDRSGRVTDPFGHVWLISTHVEDVSYEEMQRRFAAMMGG